MKELLPPHGGCGLINRVARAQDKERIIETASKGKVYTISDADLSVFFRIADGTLSPLEGPMNEAEYLQVLNEETILRHHELYAWTIPIAFAALEKEASSFKPGETVLVRDLRDVVVGAIEISDVYLWDKDLYNEKVYGTDRRDHPGPRIANDDPRESLIGGKIWAFDNVRYQINGKYMLTPKDCRKVFSEKGWERITAFQTRNPLHRAHEYAMVHALESLIKQGFSAGVILNPLVGETKSDDVPAAVRMKTYEALINGCLIGDGDKDEAIWKTIGHDIVDNILLIGLDMRMYYAGPKEAVMHAIYRQNLGCTDIIIGRKHADAPFDDGTPVWGDFEAQEKFSKLSGDLCIKPFKVGTAAFFEELGRVALVEEHKESGFTEVALSGKELRRKLQAGEPIDERIMRKSVAEILYEAYRNNIGGLRKTIKSQNITWHRPTITGDDRQKKAGHKPAVIWLTGLPCSGKSTIAVELQKAIFARGCNAFILDGDNIRHGLNRDLGFAPEDREENIRRIGEVAKLFVEAGFIVITAFVSPYRKDRENARSLLASGEFIEAYVRTSLATCEKRDVKGLYKKARAGEIKEFTGITAAYEEPGSPELIIDTDDSTKEESAGEVLRYLESRGYFL